MKYVLTKAGERYLSRVNAQMMPMHILRVETGEGTVEQPEQLIALVDKKQILQLETIEQDDNEAVIHCMLTNLELHTAYLLQQSAVIAYDSIDNEEKLIFIGQDVEGERIPAIEEREVQYLHNIALRVSSTQQITFDVSVSDFVRKGYLVQKLEEHGRVLVGDINTPIRQNDILLVVHDGFQAAAFTNMEFSAAAPATVKNWGKPQIVDGKLVVAEQPEKNTTFFAQVEEKDNG